jgi:hypothetical protein
VSEQVVIFRFPKKYIAPEDMESYEEIKLPWVEGKSLKLYYRDTRFTYHLSQLNTRHNVRKSDTRECVRTSYVPQPGELFLFIPAGRSLS